MVRPLLLLFCVLPFHCGRIIESRFSGVVDLGTHRLHYESRGEGSPAIVVDVGIAESHEEWLSLLGQFSDRCRIICYDRAGYGRSGEGPYPRDGERVAEELNALLDSIAVSGPILLVGHSLGALNLQIFAARFPNRAGAMLLLDPPPIGWLTGGIFPGLRNRAEEQTRVFKATAESLMNAKDGAEKKRASFFRTIASEHREMFALTARQAAAIDSFPGLPLVVIAAGMQNPAFGPDAEAYRKFWNEQCRNIAGKSNRGRYVLAEESSHHLHRDAPRMVIEAVDALIAEIRMDDGDGQSD